MTTSRQINNCKVFVILKKRFKTRKIFSHIFHFFKSTLRHLPEMWPQANAVQHRKCAMKCVAVLLKRNVCNLFVCCFFSLSNWIKQHLLNGMSANSTLNDVASVQYHFPTRLMISSILRFTTVQLITRRYRGRFCALIQSQRLQLDANRFSRTGNW